MIVLIDNYDSFVYTLDGYVRRCGFETQVLRNDDEELNNIKPQALILSPGPCTPNETGLSKQIVEKFYKDVPLLGICLGHQIIAEVFGGKTISSPYPHHGKTSDIYHENHSLFEGLPSPFKAARYHSLISQIPDNGQLRPIAKTDDNILMGFEHNDYPVYGLQFHPESVLTSNGFQIIQNFAKVIE